MTDEKSKVLPPSPAKPAVEIPEESLVDSEAEVVKGESEERSKVLPPAPPTPREGAPAAPLNGSGAKTLQHEPEVVEKAAKSPLAAALLAFFPFGLGHFYLGQYARALCFFAAFWVTLLVLQVPLLAVFFYFFGIFDAFRQAQLINLAIKKGVEKPATSYEGGLAAGVFLLALGGYLLLRQFVDLSFIRVFIQQWWPGILVLIGLWMIVGAIREQKRPKEDGDLYSDLR